MDSANDRLHLVVSTNNCLGNARADG